MTLSKMPIKFLLPGLESTFARAEATPKERPAALKRLWRALIAWRQRSRAERMPGDVRGLDDRLLADIGLVRGEPAYTAVVAGWHVGPHPIRPPVDRPGMDGWDHL